MRHVKKTVIILTLSALSVKPVLSIAQSILNAPKPKSISSKSSFVQGEVIVQFKPSLSRNLRRQAAVRMGAQEVQDLDEKGTMRLKLPEGQSTEESILELSKNTDLAFVQPNYIYHASAVPNDPLYGQLWALKNTAQTISASSGPNVPSATNNPGTSGKDMSLESAWDVTTDCSSVVIAVIDSGINYNHADLTSNLWNGGATYPNHGWNFVDNNNNPMDLNGHGTHVAGTIGARGNNGTGITGVCWSASLMAIKVLNTLGSGTTAGIVQGINFAVTNGAKILNMSLGGPNFDQAQYNAIEAAKNAGALVVAAAGNYNENVDQSGNALYPCSYNLPNIICVAALDQAYQIASFSNRGPNSVDIAAPGVNILSAWPGAHTTLVEPLTSGWTRSPSSSLGFGYKVLSSGSTNYHSLVAPANYGTSNYTNNLDARAYKSFNLTGYNAATLNMRLTFDVQEDYDFFLIYAKTTSGDPVSGGTLLDWVSGNLNGYLIDVEYDITPYLGSNSTMGFRLLSDSIQVDSGVAIVALEINRLNLNTFTYNVIAGTSMAAPNVAGLAGLLMTYNPSFTYSDTINAIKNGGTAVSALSTVTVSGRAANALGALSHIAKPTITGLMLQ